MSKDTEKGLTEHRQAARDAMAADEESSNVTVSKSTMALLLEQIDKQREATQAERDHHNDLNAQIASTSGQITKMVLFMAFALIVGLLAVVGVYVTVGLPGGGTVDATRAADVDAELPDIPLEP